MYQDSLWEIPQDACWLITYNFPSLLLFSFSLFCIWFSSFPPEKRLVPQRHTHVSIAKVKPPHPTTHLNISDVRKKIYLHLHPPFGLWPLSNTWLFGEFFSLRLFGQLPYPTGNTRLSLKELIATGRFWLTNPWATVSVISSLHHVGSVLSLEVPNSCQRSSVGPCLRFVGVLQS